MLSKMGPKERGQKLRSFRDRAKVSMRDLAATSGMDFSPISRYESGERALSLDTYLHLLAAIEKLLDERGFSDSTSRLAQNAGQVRRACVSLRLQSQVGVVRKESCRTPPTKWVAVPL
jgi:transcriptional regulator with XRE-family HTH domain